MTRGFAAAWIVLVVICASCESRPMAASQNQPDVSGTLQVANGGTGVTAEKTSIRWLGLAYFWLGVIAFWLGLKGLITGRYWGFPLIIVGVTLVWHGFGLFSDPDGYRRWLTS